MLEALKTPVRQTEKTPKVERPIREHKRYKFGKVTVEVDKISGRTHDVRGMNLGGTRVTFDAASTNHLNIAATRFMQTVNFEDTTKGATPITFTEIPPRAAANFTTMNGNTAPEPGQIFLVAAQTGTEGKLGIRGVTTGGVDLEKVIGRLVRGNDGRPFVALSFPFDEEGKTNRIEAIWNPDEVADMMQTAERRRQERKAGTLVELPKVENTPLLHEGKLPSLDPEALLRELIAQEVRMEELPKTTPAEDSTATSEREEKEKKLTPKEALEAAVQSGDRERIAGSLREIRDALYEGPAEDMFAEGREEELMAHVDAFLRDTHQYTVDLMHTFWLRDSSMDNIQINRDGGQINVAVNSIDRDIRNRWHSINGLTPEEENRSEVIQPTIPTETVAKEAQNPREQLATAIQTGNVDDAVAGLTAVNTALGLPPIENDAIIDLLRHNLEGLRAGANNEFNTYLGRDPLTTPQAGLRIRRTPEGAVTVDLAYASEERRNHWNELFGEPEAEANQRPPQVLIPRRQPRIWERITNTLQGGADRVLQSMRGRWTRILVETGVAAAIATVPTMAILSNLNSHNLPTRPGISGSFGNPGSENGGQGGIISSGETPTNANDQKNQVKGAGSTFGNEIPTDTKDQRIQDSGRSNGATRNTTDNNDQGGTGGNQLPSLGGGTGYAPDIQTLQPGENPSTKLDTEINQLNPTLTSEEERGVLEIATETMISENPGINFNTIQPDEQYKVPNSNEIEAISQIYQKILEGNAQAIPPEIQDLFNKVAAGTLQGDELNSALANLRRYADTYSG